MRNKTLDVLRGAAILLVFLRHTGAPILGRVGWSGVDLFFVLSGFLVSGLLFSEYQRSGSVAPGRFLIRRGFKIYPQFYLLAALTLVWALAAADPMRPAVNLPRLQIGNIVRELVFLQNYSPGMWWVNTWSLAVEEHFYLLLALAIALVSRRGALRLLPRWIFILCGGVLAARILTWIAYPGTSDWVHIFPTHLRVDSLLAGVLVAYYRAFHGEALAEWVRRAGDWIAPVSLACLAPILFLEQSDPFIYTAGFSLVAIGFALLLIVALYPARVSTPGPIARSAAWLGRISYAFYLCHAPALFFVDYLFAGRAVPGWAADALAFSLTVLVAYSMTRLVEQPFLRLRDYWFPGRASGGFYESTPQVRLPKEPMAVRNELGSPSPP